MKPTAEASLVIYAPNVHQGGGLVLLRALLQVESLQLRQVFLDLRAQTELPSLDGGGVHFVRRSVLFRLWAEWKLWWGALPGDTVLCFHGLPPLLPQKGNVVVFIQNRLLVEGGGLANYPFRIRARLWLERLWSRGLQSHCSRYIVQTPSMANAVKRWLKRALPISITPFADNIVPAALPNVMEHFDFVYVASGEAHKNHLTLIEAWRLLADAGVKPTLALTLDARINPILCRHLASYAAEYGLAVTNLGQLDRSEISALYRAAGALIYPSTAESFGLPLVEAAQLGLPILASELDYVRDVVYPIETFDPASPLSISRAVLRFIGREDTPLPVGKASDFLDEILR